MICMEDPGSLDMAVQGQWPAAEQVWRAKGQNSSVSWEKGRNVFSSALSGLPYITETKKNFERGIMQQKESIKS